MADDSRPSLTLARLGAIITTATSATLGVLKLTGGTMSGAIAMGSNLVTGLAQATAAGHALRYEALGAGTLPTVAMFPTARTATNCTLVAFASDDAGVHMLVTQATASARLTSQTTAGTRIAAKLRGGTLSTGVATACGGGAGLVLTRADGAMVALYRDAATVVVGKWASKDALAAALLTAGVSQAQTAPGWYRLGETGGNVVAEVSADGVTWTTIYSAATATAFGSAGAVLEVGPVVMAYNATCVLTGTWERVTVTP